MKIFQNVVCEEATSAVMKWVKAPQWGAEYDIKANRRTSQNVYYVSGGDQTTDPHKIALLGPETASYGF